MKLLQMVRLIVGQVVILATIKVFGVNGVKTLKCFDTLDNVEYDIDTEEEIVTDDGELTVGLPVE